MLRVSKYLVGYGGASAAVGATLALFDLSNGRVLGAPLGLSIGLPVLLVSLLAVVTGAIGLLICAIRGATRRAKGQTVINEGLPDERPADPMPPERSLFVLGLFLGVPAGAMVLSVILSFTLGRLIVHLGGSLTFALLVDWAFGFALGAFGFWVSLSQRNFLSGSILGAAAGLLGWTAMLGSVSGGTP